VRSYRAAARSSRSIAGRPYRFRSSVSPLPMCWPGWSARSSSCRGRSCGSSCSAGTG
jgi:hypothetical protein